MATNAPGTSFLISVWMMTELSNIRTAEFTTGLGRGNAATMIGTTRTGDLGQAATVVALDQFPRVVQGPPPALVRDPRGA
jgi:hypothetical protein